MTETTEQIQSLSLADVHTARQVREHFDEDDLQGLAATLEVGPLQQPIRVRRTARGYTIIDGERRYRAAQIAGWTSIPAIIELRDLSEGEILEQQLVANCARTDLSALEKSRGIHRLIETMGWSAAEVSRHLGMSPPTVSRLMSLLTLPLEIQDRIEAGEISPSSGYELTKIPDVTAQFRLAEELAGQSTEGGWTRDRLRAHQRRTRTCSATSNNSSASLTRAVACLGEGRSVTVTGASLDLDRFIELLEQTLSRAKKAHRKGISLSSHLKLLRSAAQAASQTNGG